MWKQFKKLISLNKGDFILTVSLTAGIFLLTQIIIAVVMVAAKPEEGIQVSGMILVFSSVIMMLVLTLSGLLVNYPQAIQFGCTRRRGLLLNAGLMGVEYFGTVFLVAVSILIEQNLCPPFWNSLTGHNVDLVFLDGIQPPWWLVLAAPLGGVALGLFISAVIFRFGRVGGWTLYTIWMAVMLGQSFLPWAEHWWTAPWLYPAVWVLVLAGTVWSVWTLLRVTVKA